MKKSLVDGKKNKVFTYSALIVIYSLLSFLITSFYDSVSIKEWNALGFDQGCFYVIGQGMRLGKIPYLDFYDNKGMLTYWIYEIISRFNNFRAGIFIAQAILVFVSLFIIRSFVRELGVSKNILAYQMILFLLYDVACSDSGLYTEDIVMPLIILSFYVALKLLKLYEVGGDKKGLLKCYYALSVLFWLVVIIRLNCAITIAGMLFCIGLIILFNKDFKSFWKLILSFVVCAVVVCAPVVVWLYSHGALYECIYQSFLVNFSYSKSVKAYSSSEIFLTISVFSSMFYGFVLLSVLCLGYTLVKNWQKIHIRNICFVVFMAQVFSIISISVITSKLYHYLSTVVVVSIISLFLAISSLIGSFDKSTNGANLLRSIVVALLTICVLFYASVSIVSENDYKDISAQSIVTSYKNHFTPTASEFQVNAKYIGEQIPESERDSVFSLDTDPRFYVYNNLQPCKRMFVCRRVFTYANEDLHKEYLSYFENDSPKWIVMPNLPSDDQELEAIINKRYKLKCQVGDEKEHTQFILYQLMDGQQ